MRGARLSQVTAASATTRRHVDAIDRKRAWYMTAEIYFGFRIMKQIAKHTNRTNITKWIFVGFVFFVCFEIAFSVPRMRHE